MITYAIANGLTDRAISAYKRNARKVINQARGPGSVKQPGSAEVVEHDGLFYIRLCNVNGILAVYQVRIAGGKEVLKGLKRWPAAVEEGM